MAVFICAAFMGGARRAIVISLAPVVTIPVAFLQLPALLMMHVAGIAQRAPSYGGAPNAPPPSVVPAIRGPAPPNQM